MRARTIVLLVLFAWFPAGALLGDGADKYAAFLSTLENLDRDKFYDVLVSELETYVRLFPTAENVDEIHFKLATLYHDKGKKIPSFYTHLQMLYYYPTSEHLAVARDRLRAVLLKERKLESLREKVEEILNPTFTDTSREGLAYAFIRDVHDYDVRSLNELLVSTCETFLAQFPTSARRDDVLFWQAELLARNKKYKRALAEYMKLTFLFEESPYLSASKLKVAELFTEKLKMHQQAILALEEFLLEFPDDPQAPYAQLYMARILEKRKKTYLEAIQAYTAVAEKYPKSPDAVPALFEAARLYEEKFKEYDQAIRVYSEIVRDYPEDEKAPYALAEAARIYEKRLKDYFNAANVYFKVYGNYPQSSIAPEALYAAAELNEKKLQNDERALMYYRLVVDQFPNHKLASKAAKRIDKISERMAKASEENQEQG